MKTSEAQEILTHLLQLAGFDVESIDYEERGDNEHYFNIHSQNDAAALIGRNGEVLRSLQSLVKNIFRTQGITEDGGMVRIDVDSYRVKQESNVLKMADNRAQVVINSGRSATLPPMSPFFRRLVHLHIKENFPHLNTFSKGAANDRCVCISAQNPSGPDDSEETTDIYAELEL